MKLARNVALLAIASFLADVSGEMLLAVLPFLLVAQGATGLAIGLVDGLADAVGHVLKPVAGRLADRWGRRKPLIVSGYLVAAVSRFGIAAATTWPVSLVFRASDRVGKGLRTAPRDALLAESVPPAQRGRAFGLHRAADTAGAVVGVSLALGALLVFGATPASIVAAGAIVGLSTVIPLLFVREVDAHATAKAEGDAPRSPRFRAFVLLAGLFALGEVSYMFFVLRVARSSTEATAVALYLLFNLVYVAAAYPAGKLGDRIGKPRVLLAGWLLFALAAALFIPAPSLPMTIAGFVLLGLSFAGFESMQRAFAADLAGARGRSTQLGWFHATIGLSAVTGGIVAGLLWDRVGEWATFAWAAGLALVAAVALSFVFVAKSRVSGTS
ncbi:MAG TPA: MFS transporter [Candidatus Thermoplasmatota archaeon]|nr:MFS transporter [Candidatus Thermoplasmatota archaeon]